MAQNWNLQFTQLLRATRPTFWDNWTLDANIQPGAVGTVDPGTGAFTYLCTLPKPAITSTNSVANDWKIMSSTVHETTTDVTLSGSATDPETGTKITAGLEVTWAFSQEGSVSSTFTMTQQAALEDFSNQIMANLPWLKQQAASVGMLDSAGEITQGFGVVTGVLYASCGLNLGSESDNSSFSLKGSVNGVNAMAGNAEAGAKGSYAETNETAAFESHLWPSEADTLAGGPIAIAFQFASFVGNQLLQGWVTNVSSITITLANNHGGTYIVSALATYQSEGKTQSTTAKVSGGLVAVMDPIPPDATNLSLDLSFEGMVHSDKHHFLWASPIVQFPTGQIIIDLRGVWPGATSATERTTGETG